MGLKPVPEASFRFVSQVLTTEWIAASRQVPRERQRVLVVLHGHGDSLKAFRSIKAELRIPELNYLLVNGPKRAGDGFGWGPLSPKRDVDLRPVRLALSALVDELKAAGWRSEQIVWLGHSQGCLAASDLVLHHSDVFGGLIGVSGYVWLSRHWRSGSRLSAQRLSSGRRSQIRATPWLLTHGTLDRVIPARETRASVLRLAKRAISVEYREFKKGHDFDYSEEVPYIRRWIKSPPM